MGPGKDTHDTPMPVKEGRGWPTTRSTVRQTCTTQRQTPLSLVTYTVAEPCSVQFSSARSSTEENDDTLDKKLTDSSWAVANNGDREHKETRLTLEATQIKSEELINKSSKPAEHVINTMEMKQLYNTIRAQGESRR